MGKRNQRKKREKTSKEKKTREKRRDEVLFGRKFTPEEIDKMIKNLENETRKKKRYDKTFFGRRLKPEEIDKMIEDFKRKVERGEDTFDDWFRMDFIKGIPGKKKVYVEEYLPPSEMHRDPEFVRKAIAKDLELARKEQKQEEQQGKKKHEPVRFFITEGGREALKAFKLIKKEGLDAIPKIKGKIDDKILIEVYTELGFKLKDIQKALKQ